jgi:hypothetical protein
MCSFTFDDSTIRSEKLTGHHAETSEALCKNVALYISVIVLSGPDEPAGRLNSLCNHIINQTVLIIDSESLKFGLVLPKKMCLSLQPGFGTEKIAEAYVSYISWKMSLNLPSYFFRMVFLVDKN